MIWRFSLMFVYLFWFNLYWEVHLQSHIGAFLDPLADKIFLGSVALGLTWAGMMPGMVSFLIIGRDILLVSGSFYLRSKEKSADSEYFDIRTTTFQIVPSDLSKVCNWTPPLHSILVMIILCFAYTILLCDFAMQLNTAVQFLLVSSTFSHYVFSFPSLAFIEPLWYITAVTSVGSGLGYLDGSGLNRTGLTKRNWTLLWTLNTWWICCL